MRRAHARGLWRLQAVEEVRMHASGSWRLQTAEQLCCCGGRMRVTYGCCGQLSGCDVASACEWRMEVAGS